MPSEWAGKSQLPAQDRLCAQGPQCSRGIDPLHAFVVVDASGGVLQLVALAVDVVAHLLVSQVLLQLLPGLLVAPETHKAQASVGMEAWDGFLPFLLPCSSRSIPACLPWSLQGFNLQGAGAAGICWGPWHSCTSALQQGPSLHELAIHRVQALL